MTTTNNAKRDSIGTKVDTTLVPYTAICAMAVGLNYGAEKYGTYNYLKGLPTSTLLMSIERHTRACMAGEWIDSESGLPHHTLLASSVAIYIDSLQQDVILSDILGRGNSETLSISNVSKCFNNYQADAIVKK